MTRRASLESAWRIGKKGTLNRSRWAWGVQRCVVTWTPSTVWVLNANGTLFFKLASSIDTSFKKAPLISWSVCVSLIALNVFLRRAEITRDTAPQTTPSREQRSRSPLSMWRAPSSWCWCGRRTRPCTASSSTGTSSGTTTGLMTRSSTSRRSSPSLLTQLSAVWSLCWASWLWTCSVASISLLRSTASASSWTSEMEWALSGLMLTSSTPWLSPISSSSWPLFCPSGPSLEWSSSLHRRSSLLAARWARADSIMLAVSFLVTSTEPSGSMLTWVKLAPSCGVTMGLWCSGSFSHAGPSHQ